MTDVHIEDHESPIKTPQQLIVVVLLSFIVPVAAILLIVKLVMGGIRVDESSNAMSEDAIANRLKPVGEVVVVAGGSTQAASSSGGGEALYNQVCQACHGAGLAGAPKTGDAAGWKTRIAQGKSTLYKNAINGKNLMPPKGGAMSASDDDIKAAVDYMLSKSK